ncbi:MAG TPA: hypothetical protein VF723_01025 [Pyrinomonadaceae bacterium]
MRIIGRKILALLALLALLVGCGGNYYQLTAEQKILAARLKAISGEYLVRKIAHASFGGNVFCAFKVLDIEERGDQVNEYLYAVCQEYSLRDGRLKEGEGLAMPVALSFRKEAGTYRVVEHRTAGDGSRYASDIKRIFPARTHAEIFSPETGALLLKEAKQEALASSQVKDTR